MEARWTEMVIHLTICRALCKPKDTLRSIIVIIAKDILYSIRNKIVYFIYFHDQVMYLNYLHLPTKPSQHDQLINLFNLTNLWRDIYSKTWYSKMCFDECKYLEFLIQELNFGGIKSGDTPLILQLPNLVHGNNSFGHTVYQYIIVSRASLSKPHTER